MSWELHLYSILGLIILIIVYKILFNLLTPFVRYIIDCIRGVKGISSPQIHFERRILSEYNHLIKLPFNDLINVLDKIEEFVIDSRRAKLELKTLLIDRDKLFVSVSGFLRYFNDIENKNYNTHRGFIKHSNGDVEKINKSDVISYKSKIKLSGDYINIYQSWLITSLANKISFICEIIKYTPNNSVWYIEGIFDKEIFLTLSSHRIIDNKNILLISNIPNENILKIILNDTCKRIIIQNISKWDLMRNFYHTQIYDNDKIYFMSLNRFSVRKIWVSFDFPRSVLNDLEDNNIIKFQEAT